MCRKHGLCEFGLYGRAQPRWKCKRCVAEWVTRRHQKLRRILVEEGGGRGAVCGYERCAYNLHFHHVDPNTKSFEMTTAAGKSLATYREEARKCVLVCANCHGEIETGTIVSPPAGAKFGGDWIKRNERGPKATSDSTPRGLGELPQLQLAVWRR